MHVLLIIDQFWNLGVVFNLFVCIESTFLQYLESNYSPSELQNQIIWNISDKSRLLGSTKNNLALHATNLSQLLHTFSLLSKVFSKICTEGTEIMMRSRSPLYRFSLNWLWKQDLGFRQKFLEKSPKSGQNSGEVRESELRQKFPARFFQILSFHLSFHWLATRVSISHKQHWIQFESHFSVISDWNTSWQRRWNRFW